MYLVYINFRELNTSTFYRLFFVYILRCKECYQNRTLVKKNSTYLILQSSHKNMIVLDSFNSYEMNKTKFFPYETENVPPPTTILNHIWLTSTSKTCQNSTHLCECGIMKKQQEANQLKAKPPHFLVVIKILFFPFRWNES